jgi:hypothetical protein
LSSQGFDFFDQFINFIGAGSGCWRAGIVGGGLGGLHEFGDFGMGRIGRGGLRRFGKFDAPEGGTGLGEFKFDVAASRAVNAFAGDLGDDFALGVLVGEKEKLAGNDGGGEADDSAVFKNEDRGGVFRKKFAVAGIVGRARPSDNDARFMRDGVGMRRWRSARRGRAARTANVHCGSHSECPLCAGGLGNAPLDSRNVEAVKNRPRDGSNDNLLLQARLLLAIVQTYCLYEGASAGNVLCADYRCRRTENSEIAKPRVAPRKTSEGK